MSKKTSEEGRQGKKIAYGARKTWPVLRGGKDDVLGVERLNAGWVDLSLVVS